MGDAIINKVILTNHTYGIYMLLILQYCSLLMFFIWFCCRYASRVRLIVNDPSKNVSSKEVARLKKLVAYWKEQAGKRGEDEELEEIQDERHSKERSEGRVSS